MMSSAQTSPTQRGPYCPLPHQETERVLLGHGSGGRLSSALLREVILPALGESAVVDIVDDAATLPQPPGLRGEGELVFTTDAFVVTPLEFPGGCVGDLAVNGTINDLAMMGGRPIALSLAYILEEGLPMDLLRRVTQAAGRAAHAAGVPIVTGDTKVVGRGAADGLYIVTSGVGVTGSTRPCAAAASAGDVVILSGPLGAHGMAVLAAREDFGFDTDLRSDTMPLHELVSSLLASAPGTHTLRDPTRGGLASSLNEIAATAGIGVQLDEASLPVAPAVRSACELLGFDPLQVANEGVCVAFVPEDQADDALAALWLRPEGAGAIAIGRAVDDHPGVVTMRTLIGSQRVVDPLVGEQLPRIC